MIQIVYCEFTGIPIGYKSKGVMHWIQRKEGNRHVFTKKFSLFGYN